VPFFYMCTNKNCTRRNADSQRVYDFLEANGWTFTEDVPRADLIVVCTCAATDNTESDSLYNIGRMLQKKSETAKMIITGCLPKINPEKLGELGNFLTVNPRSLEEFDGLVNHHVSIGNIFDRGEILVPDFVRPTDSLLVRLVRLAKECTSNPRALKLAAKRALARAQRAREMAITMVMPGRAPIINPVTTPRMMARKTCQ